ncbi:MAG: ATP-dependent zinc metalloprotease FtsH [Endomicrobium sp.]|jgi:cell division protease FtsH|nr:ATP-dependent zinc metalloprotease FtsH [Endomicrobium sp.]
MNKKKSPWYIFFWITLFIIIFMLVNASMQRSHELDLEYSQFKQYIRNGNVSKVLVSSSVIKGQFKDSDGILKKFRTVPMNDPNLIKDLEDNKVLEFSAIDKNGWVGPILINWGPIILLMLFWLWIMRSMTSNGKQMMSFGKTKVKKSHNDDLQITFQDVAGCEEAKEELQEIVEFLKNSSKFQKLGGRIPKGVLLFGSPGTGKTLLAKAVAGEAGVPFFAASGSEFVEMFVGVGASRVRDLFDQGRKAAPCLLFVDEIDAVGRHRFAGIGGHDEREQTLNQLLVEMDGFDTKEGVILLAATNRPDVLDPALLRPGRFDRQIMIPNPDLKDRKEILEVHSKKVKLDRSIDLNIIARSTPGLVGADLANIINESALLAARNNQKTINMHNIEESIERIIAGPQRKSRLISNKEKKIIAYHEVGHAIVAKNLPTADPVHKISIIPRGPALGYTIQLPEHDKYLTSKSELLDKLSILLAGRIVEELVFSEITTGAQNDILQATNIATKMVTEFGMSEKCGTITLSNSLNNEIMIQKDVSGRSEFRHSWKTYEIIDEEIKNIINITKEKSKSIITTNMDIIKRIVGHLLEKENLTGEELDNIIAGNTLSNLKISMVSEARTKQSKVNNKNDLIIMNNNVIG